MLFLHLTAYGLILLKVASFSSQSISASYSPWADYAGSASWATNTITASIANQMPYSSSTQNFDNVDNLSTGSMYFEISGSTCIVVYL